MPANLNALIRYKTIDACLSNPHRKWNIHDLIEACSLALEESRGIYTGVSERTLREDIRVMRSDILGFNAPIVQEDGYYTYKDPSYSIFNVNIKEEELLARVLKFILEIQSEVNHPDMDEIISIITAALPKEELEDEESKSEEGIQADTTDSIDDYLSDSHKLYNFADSKSSSKSDKDFDNKIFEKSLIDLQSQLSIKRDGMKWSGILNLI